VHNSRRSSFALHPMARARSRSNGKAQEHKADHASATLTRRRFDTQKRVILKVCHTAAIRSTSR
jgi:hypothetical protein